MKTEEIKRMLKHKKKKSEPMGRDYLSTGSTLLNLACTGYPHRGFAKGKYYRFVGDSTSGKTFLSLTCLSEASINPNFNNYRFIYDNAEDGALMNIEKFFGKAVSKRMEPPLWWKNVHPIFSSTIEEFYYYVDDAIKDGKPFIYILDSMDSLSSEDEQAKFDDNKKAHRRGKEATGSYGDGKAKKNSANLRRLLTPLKKSGSILIVIGQTRDNFGFGFEKKTDSGGHALKFYATLQIWTSIKQRLKKTVKGKPRQTGIKCKAKVKKNRITGRERDVIIPIYHSFGIDDIGSCVDYLLDEGHWPQKGNKIRADEFHITTTREKLIQHIEGIEAEKDLQDIVGDVWTEIEDACAVKRKKRYE